MRRSTLSAAVVRRFRMNGGRPRPGARSAPLKWYVEQVLTAGSYPRAGLRSMCDAEASLDLLRELTPQAHALEQLRAQ